MNYQALDTLMSGAFSLTALSHVIIYAVMKAKFNNQTGHVSAYCPDCGAISNFTRHNVLNSQKPGVSYAFHQCTGCGRGGVAEMANGKIESFFPYARNELKLPADVPAEIVKEFREAELCTSFGACRAASALFRSALEKTLKANGYILIGKKGYDTMNLQKKIDEAAADAVITESLRVRAHNEIRVLGNDVLHDDWKEISAEDVEASHHYTQRILECFYDHRPSVETILIAKNRIPPPSQQASQQQTPT